MVSSNKKIGNRTEFLYLEKVKVLGGWATLIPPTQLGQPFDTVAVFKEYIIFADIKHCEKDRFNFSHIEDNQKMAMQVLSDVGNRNIKIGFMIYFEPIAQFRWLSFEEYRERKERNITSILWRELDDYESY